MKFLSRRDWGARPSERRVRLDDAAGVAIHWHGTPTSISKHTQCVGRVRAVQAFHMDTRGWADIAYSALVCPHQHVFEGRGLFTRTAANGTVEGNDRFYAVCYLGGRGEPLTEGGRLGLVDAVAWLRTRGDAGDELRPHDSFKPTGCPGEGLKAFLPELGVLLRPPPVPATGWGPFPLPDGHWYGVDDGTVRSHSGKRAGDRDEVVRIQRKAGADDDGLFGPQTARKVTDWQRRRGLTADGAVGPQTWGAMGR